MEIEEEVIAEWDKWERNKKILLFGVAAALVTTAVILTPSILWGVSFILNAGIIVWSDKLFEKKIKQDKSEGRLTPLDDFLKEKKRHFGYATILDKAKESLKEAGIDNYEILVMERENISPEFYRRGKAFRLLNGKAYIFLDRQDYDSDMNLSIMSKTLDHEIGHILNRDSEFRKVSKFISGALPWAAGLFLLRDIALAIVYSDLPSISVLQAATVLTAAMASGELLERFLKTDGINEKRADLHASRGRGLYSVIEVYPGEDTRKWHQKLCLISYRRYPSLHEKRKYLEKVQRVVNRRYKNRQANQPAQT